MLFFFLFFWRENNLLCGFYLHWALDWDYFNILFLNISLVLQRIVPNSGFTGLNTVLYIYIYMEIGDSEGFWLGSCLKLKVRRFHGDYHMPVSSLSVCKYGWWRHSWSPVVVVLFPISAEWGSEVYPSAPIHSTYRFPQELNQLH